MNRALYFVFIFVLLTAGVSGQQKPIDAADPSTWSKYTVKGEEFSVTLPTHPSMVTSKKERTERHLATSFNGIQYGIDIIQNSKRQSLEDFIAEYNPKGENSRPITVDGIAGREFSAPAPSPATVQFFATERRLYRFVAVGADINNAAVRQFFSSIVLGEKADGAAIFDGPGMPLVIETGERIYKSKETDKRIRLISKPEPQCPGNCGRGKVVLQAMMSKTGKITNIQIISAPNQELAGISVAAAEKITFEPAMKDGKPVSIYMTLEYNYNW